MCESLEGGQPFRPVSKFNEAQLDEHCRELEEDLIELQILWENSQDYDQGSITAHSILMELEIPVHAYELGMLTEPLRKLVIKLHLRLLQDITEFYNSAVMDIEHRILPMIWGITEIAISNLKRLKIVEYGPPEEPESL